MSNNLITKSQTPTLTWAAITGATLYTVQFCLDQRFTTIEYSDTALATASVTPTALADAKKHYWRFRAKVSGAWQKWQPVRSIWVSTAFANSYAPPTTGWVFMDPDDVTDYYEMAVAPEYQVNPVHKRRSQVENISGDLLSEFVSTRDEISLVHDSGYVGYDQMAEILRWFNKRKSVFLMGVTDYVQDKHERIWKVDFTDDPKLSQLAPGREDYWYAEMSLMESALT